MKKGLTLLCTIWLMLTCCIHSMAQVSVTYTSTASICYNDGTLTAVASGGIAPYTYSILTGPSGPSMTYPITLPAGSSTFANLPAGAYTVQATDATGATGSVGGTVGGAYQFPTCSAIQSGLDVICNAVRGNTPYQYAISSTGVNSGFGPYQSSNTFSGLCPGTYWVRVQDACGNIYTSSIAFTYSLAFTLQCVNFTQGTLSVTAQGGRSPYTYTAVGQSNQTGVFTGLGRGYSGAFSVTDACGKVDVFQVTPATAQFTGHCPYDSAIYLSRFQQTQGLPQPASVTYVCTSCIPVQSVTNPPSGSPLFQHIAVGQSCSISVITSDCGGDTTYAHFTPTQASGNVRTLYLGCNSFKVTLSGASGPVNLADIDSFVLVDFSTQATLQVNHTGIFHGLPAGAYNVIIYAPRACLAPTRALVTVPHLPSSCSYLMKDASCQSLWEYSITPFDAESYTLTSAAGQSIPAVRNMRGSQPVINFYNIQPGIYTLVSDSGCTWQPTFDPPPAIHAFGYSSVSCTTGGSYLHIADTPSLYCNNILLKIYHGNTQVWNTAYPNGQISVNVNVVDSGWYRYQVYATSYGGDTSLVSYDTICPMDTGAIYMGYGSVPYPYSDVLYSCGSSSRPVYHIYGGKVPYTVEMPGVDTVVLYSNTGIFPTGAAGSYAIIAYDSCGISRSFTLTIVDTCTPVNCATLQARSDTAVCSGRDVLLTSDVTIPGGVFSWSGGGSHQDTLVAPLATTTYIVSYALSRCPVVTDTVTITATAMPTVQVDDAAACSGQPVTLTARAMPAGGTYSWSPGGAATPAITVSPTSATSYTVSYSIIGCPAVSDSATVTPVSGPATAARAVTAICYSPGGKAIAQPAGGTPPYSYSWSDAAHTTTDTLAGLYAGSAYTVTVSDQNLCSATASVQVPGTIQPLALVQDSVADLSCAGSHDGYISISVLNSSHCTYQWIPGGSDSTLTHLMPGSYTVTVTDPAGCSGTMSFTIHEPPAVTLEVMPVDTIVKEGEGLYLTSLLSPYPSGAVSYSWTPAVGLSCYTCPDPIFRSTAASYEYTLVVSYGTLCRLADIVRVRVYSEHLLYTPNAFTPNSDGKNDIFYAYPVGARYFDMKIFDRWGEKVFESLDPAIGWDGTYRGQLQEPGTFVCLVDVTFNDGYTIQDKGTLTLIR